VKKNDFMDLMTSMQMLIDTCDEDKVESFQTAFQIQIQIQIITIVRGIEVIPEEVQLQMIRCSPYLYGHITDPTPAATLMHKALWES